MQNEKKKPKEKRTARCVFFYVMGKDKLMFIVQFRTDEGVTFLCPYKKVTKENVWGMR